MLRLTKIELNGFKSFAAPTAIDTGDSLLGVVGPNGAGKSNVLDAIHFVFGEQKPTVLRVSRLSDLIFGGSRTHGQLNLARVRLTFEFAGEDDEEEQALLDEFGLVPLAEGDETVTYASTPYGSEVQELLEARFAEDPPRETGSAFGYENTTDGAVVESSESSQHNWSRASRSAYTSRNEWKAETLGESH